MTSETVSPPPPRGTTAAGSDPFRRHSRRWSLPATGSSLSEMRQWLRVILGDAGLFEADADDLVLAASEAASNAIEHAQTPSAPFFDVLTEITGDAARIVVRDYGRWREQRAPTSGRGRGLRMMDILAEVTITAGRAGTAVIICTRPPGSPAQRSQPA